MTGMGLHNRSEVTDNPYYVIRGKYNISKGQTDKNKNNGRSDRDGPGGRRDATAGIEGQMSFADILDQKNNANP